MQFLLQITIEMPCGLISTGFLNEQRPLKVDLGHETMLVSARAFTIHSTKESAFARHTVMMRFARGARLYVRPCAL